MQQEVGETVGVRCLEKLAALVLLGGSVRASRLSQTIGRSVLDLPVESGLSLLERWRDEAGRLALGNGLRRLAMRVMVDRDAAEPKVPVAHEHTIVSVERDPFEYRGTGGVLKDLSSDYADDDYILVASAAQILLEDLTAMATALGECESDVSLLAPHDGAPAGLMLIRCAALRGISESGFVDLKEQALPAIGRTHRVEVVPWETSSALPVRNLTDYISALRSHHLSRKGQVEVNPYAEDWESAFSLVEAGANVAGDACVHDSVVLKDAKVEAGAVVVRSVVGPHGVVRKGQMVVEALVSGERSA